MTKLAIRAFFSKTDARNMQVKWLLSNWLFPFFPLFFLPPRLKSLRAGTNSSSASCLSSLLLIDHHLKSARQSWFSFDRSSSLENQGCGDAWTAAVQAAVGILPWLGVAELCGRRQSSATSKSDYCNGARKRTNRLPSPGYLTTEQEGVCGNILTPVSLTYICFFFAIFERLLNNTKQLCFPAVLAVSSAIMPPFGNSPSKFLPPHVDMLEVADSMDQNSESQVCRLDGGLKAESLNETVVEPKTGFKFPMVMSREICQDEAIATNSQVLAGVGVRNVTVVKLKTIKIYAFGFYIKVDKLKSQLGEKYATVPPDELKHDSCFYEDLLRHDLEMTVRLMIHKRGLKMGMVRSAFDASLKNRLKKIKGVEADEGLNIFNSYFSENLLLSRGSIVDFQWIPGGQLRTEIDGRLIGTIHSHDLCRAFFDIFIGDPPVSLKAKQDIGEKLGHMLRSS